MKIPMEKARTLAMVLLLGLAAPSLAADWSGDPRGIVPIGPGPLAAEAPRFGPQDRQMIRAQMIRAVAAGDAAAQDAAIPQSNPLAQADDAVRTEDGYRAEKARIDQALKDADRRCDAMKGRAAKPDRARCEAEAKGAHRIALADLEARREPTPERLYAVRQVRADVALAIASTRCEALRGRAEDVCTKDAKASHVAAVERAKVELAAATATGPDEDRAARTAEARRDAARRLREANQAAARERCEVLDGDARAECLASVRKRFGS